ncbi:unnamed protein product [Adineta steineri]|uniref:Hint domain-containing protein n=1 Tax=Adineta steineri TaxID=433720 RepID=A0A818TV07_9BILA|nr:unnamed protein product [Adineta steineri]
MDRRFLQFKRRLATRHLPTIIQLVVISFVFATIIYMSAKFFYPSISNFMAPTTLPTTPRSTTTTIRTTTQQPFEIGCFFDKTNITLADGSTRSLDALNIGDEVLVYLPSGQFEKSRVLTVFNHQRSSVRFLDIHTIDNQDPLRLTPSHSILTKKNNIQQSSFYYDYASNIAIGDFVLSAQLKARQVINIKETILYNQTISTPLTFEGNIIVNNLIASCYATYHHKFMHILSIPIRYWYQIETFPQFNHFIIHLIELYSKLSF